MQAAVYTTGELEKVIGVRNDRIRNRWLRYLRYIKKNPRDFMRWKHGKDVYVIPEQHLPALFRDMTEFIAETEDVKKARELWERSVLTGVNWGVIVLRDYRGRPAPAFWEVRAGKLRAGFMVIVPRSVEGELKALLGVEG